MTDEEIAAQVMGASLDEIASLRPNERAKLIDLLRSRRCASVERVGSFGWRFRGRRSRTTLLIATTALPITKTAELP